MKQKFVQKTFSYTPHITPEEPWNVYYLCLGNAFLRQRQHEENLAV